MLVCVDVRTVRCCRPCACLLVLVNISAGTASHNGMPALCHVKSVQCICQLVVTPATHRRLAILLSSRHLIRIPRLLIPTGVQVTFQHLTLEDSVSFGYNFGFVAFNSTGVLNSFDCVSGPLLLSAHRCVE